MPVNKTYNNVLINIFRLVFSVCGILAIVLGFYATGPRLVEFVTQYFSPDKELSKHTIAFLHGFRTKIILSGVILLILSMLVSYFVRYFLLLKNLILRKLQIGHLIQKAFSLTKRFFSSLYLIGTNKKFLWCFLTLMLIAIQIPGIFLSPWGGLHVEGIDLNPAKNLARHGIYGTLTTGGFDELTYRISAGPGILLPHALIFKVFGINVHYSRVLQVAYVVATLIVFYHVARYLYSQNVALLSLAMFTPMIMSGSLMASEGYTPGLCYFLIGTLFWCKSIDLRKKSYLFIGGLFWALSFQTKWLFLFAVFALLVTWIILRFSKNRLSSQYWIIPCSMVLLVTMLWVSFRILNIGFREEYFHLVRFWKEHGDRAMGMGVLITGPHIPIFGILRPLVTLSQVDLWGELQLFLLIPAVIYIIILISKSKMADARSLYLINFVLLWFLWWFLFNYDLPRVHLSVVRLVSQLFIAKFLYDLWKYATDESRSSPQIITAERGKTAAVLYPVKVLITIIVLTTIMLPLCRKANLVYGRDVKLSKAYREMITYIRTNTEKNAVFSGWNWSLPWHVDLDDDGDHLVKDRRIYAPNQRESVPEYFIVAPEWPLVRKTTEWPMVAYENEWTRKENAKRVEFLKKHASLVKTFSADKHKWLLFKVKNDKLARVNRE